MTPSFMLAGSLHARVCARWIIARLCLLDPHARLSVPAGSPHARACWIPVHLCLLDPRTPVPAGSPHARACWIPARPCPLDPHARPCPCPPDPHACPCPCPLDPYARMHAHIHRAHARTPNVHARPSPHSHVGSRRLLARRVPTLAYAASLARIYASAGCVMYASLSFM